MYEKNYQTNNLYIGIISRQTSKQNGNFWGLLNIRYCVLLKETNERYRCVLTDGIYSVSSPNTQNQDVINLKTIIPLVQFKPELENSQYITRSEINNLEQTELAELFNKVPKFQELRHTEIYR